MPDRIQRFTDRVVLSLGLRSSLKWHSLWVTLSNKNVMYILFLTTCELLKLLTESKLKAINRIHLKTDLIFKSCQYLKAIFFWDRVYSISHYQLVTPKCRENIQNIFDQNLVNPV